ncbi:MAG TPA: hypothetical protein VM008_15150, partial [Phycisphaerae bacterium]|nr:hypothetical protein [Phycisphaerae bacterium]
MRVNSRGMGSFLQKLGARGIVSCMDGDRYKAIEIASKKCGMCMAGPLNECQRKGEIQHLILIPRDAAALAEMRRASIGDGQRFR